MPASASYFSVGVVGWMNFFFHRYNANAPDIYREMPRIRIMQVMLCCDISIRLKIWQDVQGAYSTRALLNTISETTNPMDLMISILNLYDLKDHNIESIVYNHISKWICKNATLEICVEEFEGKIAKTILLTLKFKEIELFFEIAPFQTFSEFLEFN